METTPRIIDLSWVFWCITKYFLVFGSAMSNLQQVRLMKALRLCVLCVWIMQELHEQRGNVERIRLWGHGTECINVLFSGTHFTFCTRLKLQLNWYFYTNWLLVKLHKVSLQGAKGGFFTFNSQLILLYSFYNSVQPLFA